MLQLLLLCLIATLGNSMEVQHGQLSYYASGQLRADGSKYNPKELGIALNTPPDGRLCIVSIPGGLAMVKHNDRNGNPRRLGDVSLATAQQLGLTHVGVAVGVVVKLPSLGGHTNGVHTCGK